MCRFTLYLGPPVRLSSLLLEPSHSLIRQSTHSHEREEPLNGDGFGVGWYAPEYSPEPAVFRSVTPAWNNRNLHNLARVVASSCIMAHVRAATQASGVNEANCHPFRFRQYLCMHNGDVGNFRVVRRRLLESICDEAFQNVFGSTDSEHLFAVIIDELLKQPAADDSMPAGTRLALALDNAIRRITDIVATFGNNVPSYLNVALSDGTSAVISRYCNDLHAQPETLYYYCGDLYESDNQHNPGNDEVVISSERLTQDAGWQAVPANHMIVISRGQSPRLLACGYAGEHLAA